MTNFEFYKDKIKQIGIHNLALDKETEKPCACYDVKCADCKFSLWSNGTSCVYNELDWLMQEHEEENDK